MNQKTSICVIIPCFNEALRLPVDAFKSYLSDKKNEQVCLFFVNDGSSDNTSEVLNAINAEFSTQTKVLDLTKNGGKAEAVRQGMKNALTDERNFKWFGYFDADLATPLPASLDLYEVAVQKNYELVLGSRVLLMGHNIQRDNFRHYFGRIFATFASILLKLPIYDTQCGAKLIQRNTVEKVFNEPFISPWLFDVEMIARMIQVFGRDFVVKNTTEFPLKEWIEMHDSKIKPSHWLKTPFEFLKIRAKYKKYL